MSLFSRFVPASRQDLEKLQNEVDKLKMEVQELQLKNENLTDEIHDLKGAGMKTDERDGRLVLEKVFRDIAEGLMKELIAEVRQGDENVEGIFAQLSAEIQGLKDQLGNIHGHADGVGHLSSDTQDVNKGKGFSVQDGYPSFSFGSDGVFKSGVHDKHLDDISSSAGKKRTRGLSYDRRAENKKSKLVDGTAEAAVSFKFPADAGLEEEKAKLPPVISASNTLPYKYTYKPFPYGSSGYY